MINTFDKFLSSRIRSEYLIFTLVLVISFYPVVAVLPFFLGVVSTPISVSYRAGYLFLALLIVGFTILQKEKAFFSRGIVYLLFFFFLYGIRLVYDLSIRDIKVYESDVYFFQYAIGGTMVPIIAVASFFSKVDSDKFIRWIFFFSLTSCLAILLMVVSSGGFLESLVQSRVRVFSADEESIVGPIIVSREGGFLANLSLFYLLGRYPKAPGRWLLASSFFLGMMLLIVGASRGPLIAAMAIVFVQLMIYFWRHLTSVKFWSRLSLGIICIIAPGLFYILNYTSVLADLTIVSRFTAFSSKGFKKEVRALQWEASWEQIKSSPIWGERIVENLYGHSPHNLFIEVQLALGMVGSGLFTLTLIYTLKNFLTELHFRTSFVGIHFLLWLYLLYGMTGISIHTSPQVWLLMAVATYSSYTVKRFRLAPI